MGIDAKISAIQKGIKTIGIGKKGSRSLSKELVQEILQELSCDQVLPAVKGAFFGALVMKGLSKGFTEDEKHLEQAFAPGVFQDSKQLAQILCADAPLFIQDICAELLRGEILDKNTAERLGDFLFSNDPGDSARGLAASILRVRYETPEEYEGLFLSLQKTFEPAFREPVPQGELLIQIAEPFDGVDQSNMITPLLGEFLQNLNYRVVHLVGRNSGPKMVYNLLDSAKAARAQFLKNNRELGMPKPVFGWFLNQEDLSEPLDHWVDIRRQIIKRPFLAALERFVNPLNADIIIASAFHAPYAEKMTNICQRAGFPGIIIVRNGIEGTMGFPLKRPAKILCSSRQKDGNYLRHEITFDTQKFLGEPLEFEENMENPCAQRNGELIHQYQDTGETGNRHFDLRVKATREGLRLAIEWIRNNQK